MSNRKKANVLFVYPNKETILRIPLAISVLSSCLKKEGHQVKLLDSTFIGHEFKTDIQYSEQKRTVKKTNLRDYIGELDHRSLDQIIQDMLKDFPLDLITITILERNYSNSLFLLRKIKQYTKAPVLAGGIMASICPDKLISEDEIDMICLGEGEGAIVEAADRLANGEGIENVRNLWVKKGGKIIKNQMRELVDLNTLPDQDWKIFDPRHIYRAFKGKVLRNGTFEFSRGCDKICSFCVAPQLRKMQKDLGRYHRFKTPERIIEEIVAKKQEYDLSLIHFGDTDFLSGIKLEDLQKFAEMYKKQIDLPFLIQTGAETINEDKAKLISMAGCANISVGVESGSDRIRREVIHKYVSKERIKQAFHWTRKYKIGITANYMVGLPTETEEDIWESIKFNREINPPAVAVFFFTPFIGTELYDICLERGYIDGFDPDTNLHKESPLKMPQISKERIQEMMKIFVDDFETYKDEY